MLCGNIGFFFTNTQKYPKCISFSQFFYISLPKGRASLLVHIVSHDVELMQWKFCGIWNSPKLKQGQMLLLSIKTQDFLMNVKNVISPVIELIISEHLQPPWICKMPKIMWFWCQDRPCLLKTKIMMERLTFYWLQLSFLISI